MSTPILMLGAGQMGGAILNGWRLAKAFSSADLMIADPKPGDAAKAAEADGARLNPPKKDFKLAQTVMLAVKPQMWRGAAEQYAPLISKDAVVISIAAGIKSVQLSEAFGRRPGDAHHARRHLSGHGQRLRHDPRGPRPRPRPV